MVRLQEKYEQEVVPALVKEFNYPNRMAVPKITKVVINVGVGEATTNPRLLDTVSEHLAAISGQKLRWVPLRCTHPTRVLLAMG